MFLFLLSFLLLLPSPIQAIDEFKISQKIHYQVDEQGSANVRQEINLTNNISQIYAKEYEFTLSGSNIENIVGGSQVSLTEDTTKIIVKFDKPIIGKDQTNQFFINYSIPNFAQKKGNTWEVQFPTYNNTLGDNNINITLDTPISFGDLSFSSIPINNTHTLNQVTQIRFDQNQIKNKILLIFGDHQLFDFKLNYYLKNEESIANNYQIPIPPDTDHQTITFRQIDPPPIDVIEDVDGNWLATYSLNPGQGINIVAIGQAKIHAPLKLPTDIDSEMYLQSQKYWPVLDPQITAISQSLSTPQSIYKYVVNNLNYNYSRIDSAKRVGALEAITSPDNSLCTEFTDLFVTIARNKGIPAREIEGFAYSNNLKIKPINQNSDVLHAWPEYFDEKTKRWIQIDPTWEKTTNGIDYFNDLDLNHLTFVIHGMNSESPPPPGSYKINNNVKSVFVDFASENIVTDPILPILSISDKKLLIKNPNLTSIRVFDTSLPPLGSTTMDLPPQTFLQSLLPQSKTINFTVNNTTISVENKQHYLNLSITIGAMVLLLCIGGIILTVNIKTHEKNS